MVITPAVVFKKYPLPETPVIGESPATLTACHEIPVSIPVKRLPSTAGSWADPLSWTRLLADVPIPAAAVATPEVSK